MPIAPKVLGQLVCTTQSTLETLYTVPGGGVTSAVASSIVVCNRSATATTFRIAVRPAGAAINNKHYIYYGVTIAGNDTFIATIGISLNTTDVVSVWDDSASLVLSFTLFGQENS